MTTPDPAPKSRNYALWFISFMLVVIFVCGACGFLSLFTGVGRAFWDGFCHGFPLC